MFIFYFLSIFTSVYIPLYKKKVYLIHLTWVSLSFVIVVSNFDHIRYSVSYDKKGNKYTYDRFTGKKWKNLSKYSRSQ
jgi:hypothetical protein